MLTFVLLPFHCYLQRAYMVCHRACASCSSAAAASFLRFVVSVRLMIEGDEHCHFIYIFLYLNKINIVIYEAMSIDNINAMIIRYSLLTPVVLVDYTHEYQTAVKKIHICI